MYKKAIMSIMLEELGYNVIPFVTNTEELRNEMIQTCEEYPEYKTQESGNLYVMGGFAAQGNPASFHNPFVRRLREMCMVEILLSGAVPKFSDDQKIEHIIDRLMLRRKGSRPGAESWHRDEAKGTNPGDAVYGGWINLDSSEQYFSCIPGTHRESKDSQGGFAKISREESVKLKPYKRVVTIPPGSILIFNEDIVHEVLPTASGKDSYRLFLSWRVSSSETPLIANIDSIIEDQGVVPIKSGQIPAMYSKLHWTNWWDRLNAFSTMFKEVCRCQITVKCGNNAGDVRNLVYRHMPSLKQLQLELYPEYMDHEKQMLHPHNKFELRRRGSNSFKTYIY